MKLKRTSLPVVFALAFGASISAHAALGSSAAPAASAAYPLTSCVVSGDKLGEMGPAVRYVYQQAGKPDRVIEFCCKDCIADFQKDPAKYLAKLDAAAAGQSDAAASSTAPKSSAMAGCCAAGDKACCELVQGYLPIAAALAADDLAAAKTAAAALTKQADADGMKAIAEPARTIAQAADISAARDALKTLSSEVAPLVGEAKGYVVMHCPMANADWVQATTDVRNPYFGKAMLTCGAPKK